MTRRPEDSTNWGGARPGSGRKPSAHPKEKMAFSIQKDLVDWVRKRAIYKDVSMSEIVSDALQLLKTSIEEGDQL